MHNSGVGRQATARFILNIILLLYDAISASLRMLLFQVRYSAMANQSAVKVANYVDDDLDLSMRRFGFL